jgi:hypothetical protein
MANRQVRRCLVKMRWTGVLECWRLVILKGMLPMSLGYPRALSPGCGTDSKWLEISCRATPWGRECSTSQAHYRFIVFQARRQRFSNATTLRYDFQNATGVGVSKQTVRKCCMMLGWSQCFFFHQNIRRNSAPFPLKIVCFSPSKHKFPPIWQPECACNKYHFFATNCGKMFYLMPVRVNGR